MNMIRSFYKRNEKFYEQLIKVVLILVIIFVFINYIFTLIVPFAIAYLIYLTLRPIVNVIDRKTKLPRGLISIFSILIFLSLFIGLLTTIGVTIYEQAELFLKSKNYSSQILEVLDNTIFNIRSIFILFSANFGEAIVNAIIEAVYGFTDIFLKYVQSMSIQIVKALPKFIAILIISVVSSFFFLKDEKTIIKVYYKYLPIDYIKQINKIKVSVGSVTIGYVRAQMILSTVTFILAFIGLNFLGNKYSLLLATFIAFFDMLPFFGAGFILWPTALIYFLYDNTTFAIYTMILYAIIFLVRQSLEPKTLGKQISLHPLFTLFGLYVGVKIYGMVGLIIGPLTVVLIKALLTEE